MIMYTANFWKQALHRAVRTFAQTAIAAVGVGTTNLLTVDFQNVLALSVSAAVLSLLMSIDRTSETTGELVALEPPVEPLKFKSPAVVVEPEPFHGCGESLR